MLQAIVLTLKIFGIILLAILAFLLGLLLLALFCPVRYRLQGGYDGRGQLRGNVSWLFHLVSLGVRAEGDFPAKTMEQTLVKTGEILQDIPHETAEYGKTGEILQDISQKTTEDDRNPANHGAAMSGAEGEAGSGIRLRFRIFGIPVWDSSRKREKAARKAKGESQNRGKKNRIKQQANRKKKEEQNPRGDMAGEGRKARREEEMPLERKTVGDSSKGMFPDGEDFQKDTGWKGESQEDKSQEATGQEQGEPAPQGSPLGKKRHKKRKGKVSLYVRAKNAVRSFFGKIRKFRSGFTKMGDRLRQARNKTDRFREEWKDRRNRAALRLLKAEGLRLLRHIAPRKLRIRVWYGFEDPATTGRVLGFLAMIYPLFRGNLQIYPDFEQPGLKLEFAMKGRLFGAVFITSLLKLMFNKDLKHMIRKFR